MPSNNISFRLNLTTPATSSLVLTSFWIGGCSLLENVVDQYSVNLWRIYHSSNYIFLSDLKPWLLEVNNFPSLEPNSLDRFLYLESSFSQLSLSSIFGLSQLIVVVITRLSCQLILNFFQKRTQTFIESRIWLKHDICKKIRDRSF